MKFLFISYYSFHFYRIDNSGSTLGVVEEDKNFSKFFLHDLFPDFFQFFPVIFAIKQLRISVEANISYGVRTDYF